jgi:hypothetical protein
MARGRKTGGRQKGTPNKVTTDVKEMVLAALRRAGGEQYLARQAEENPSAFMALVGRIIPSQVRASLAGAEGEPITVQHMEAIEKMSIEERQRELEKMIEAAKHGPLRLMK